MLLAVVAALGALPLIKDQALNGQHGRHDRSLSAATKCKKATYAYGDSVTSTPPIASTPYTIVCESEVRGGGWTYNTLLPGGTIDTYANATGAIIVDSPAACIPAHKAILFTTASFSKTSSVAATNDMYWIRHLRLAKATGTTLSVHGITDPASNALFLASAKACTVMEVPSVNIIRTGPFYYATTNAGTFQSRAVEQDPDLNNIDYERLEKDSRPVDNTLGYHLIAAALAGTSSALPLKYPYAHAQNVLSCILYFAAAGVCGAECNMARPAAFVAGSLALARVAVDVAVPRSKLRVLTAVASHASAALVTFSFLDLPAGVWVPPKVLIEFQGALNTASSLELLPAIWRML